MGAVAEAGVYEVGLTRVRQVAVRCLERLVEGVVPEMPPVPVVRLAVHGAVTPQVAVVLVRVEVLLAPMALTMPSVVAMVVAVVVAQVEMVVQAVCQEEEEEEGVPMVTLAV